ncbi:MAG: LysR family transcriptional regulator [Proteobacteria bacterium]|nr:LysR family transcriptional regulator [Pseudomonadota bacterium]
MDKFEEMRVFAAVVDAGSFVKAADTLGISKTAASRYVSDLEQRLGVRLMNRTTRRLSLTQEGEVFNIRCREILGSIAESEAEVSTHAERASGLLKVSVPVSFGLTHVAHLWAGFMAAHPAVSLDVHLADRVVDLVDEGFDVAIRIARLPDSSLISRKLASTRMVLCASAAYLHERGVPQHPAQLSRHDVIGYSLGSMGDQWEFEGPSGPVTVRISPRLRTNNGNTNVAAAAMGAGIALEPAFLVAAELEAGRLVQVLPDYESIELGIYAVFPSRRFMLPKLRAFIDYLSHALAGAHWQAARPLG